MCIVEDKKTAQQIGISDNQSEKSETMTEVVEKCESA